MFKFLTNHHTVFHSGDTILLYFCLCQNNMELYRPTLLLLIHSSIDGYSNCFYHWANVNNAAMNIHVQVFVWTPVFNSLWYVSRSRVLELNCNCIFIFLRKCQTTVYIFCSILHFHKQCVRVPISLHCCQHFYLFFLDYNHLLYVKKKSYPVIPSSCKVT